MIQSLRHRPFSLPLFACWITASALPTAVLADDLVQARQPIVTSDLLRLRTVSSIDVHQDGSLAVLAVRSVHPDRIDADHGTSRRFTYRSHLYLLDFSPGDDNQRPRRLTHGPRNDRDPQISPDGRFVAFVRRAEDAGDDNDRTSQVWVLPLDGGEAKQVTQLEHGATRPRWSPNGRQLLVTSSIPFSELDGMPPWPSDRSNLDWERANQNDDENDHSPQPRPDGTREQIRAWLEANAGESNPNVIHRLVFQEEQRLRGEMKFNHLFVIDLPPSLDPSEPRHITHGFFDHDHAEYLPNGREVIYLANKQRDVHPDRVQTNAIWTASINGGEPRILLAIEDWRFRSPQPSADGSMIAFLGQPQDEPSFRPWQLGIASLNADALAEPMWLTDEQTFDRSVRSFQWHPTRAALLFSAASEGGFPLMTASPGLLKPVPVIQDDNGLSVGVHAFGAGGNAIVYAQTSPANPSVVRIRRGDDDRLAFDLNEWVHERELSLPREAWLTDDEGRRIHYWIMEPTRREPGEKYPLVLQIHGGPSAMWGPGELSMWHEFQLLCNWGYGVAYANPRGSGGYGYEFQRANFQDWGHGPTADVLAAVDEAMELDWVDPGRMVVTGGSYAGYLTAWIIAHDHRFKAAVAQRGVYHLPTFFGEGNAWRLLERAMGGFPWQQDIREIMERESPFNHVENIRTPLLILHASEDLRTGVSQSEMLYRALKELERPVEFARYPGAGHDLSRTGDPRQRMDRLNRIIEFFDRHIDNTREAPQLDTADESADEPEEDETGSPAPIATGQSRAAGL